MGEKKVVVSLLVLGLLVMSFVPTVFGAMEDWVEVARFTETGQSTTKTETFVCNHVDWKINWSFESNVDPPPVLFMITLYDSTDKIVDTFLTAFQGNGTLNYNTTGSFYLKIRENYVQNYQVTIEQNINSVPEFLSLIFLPLVIIGSFIIITVRKRISKMV